MKCLTAAFSLLLLLLAVSATAADPPLTRLQLDFFETKIRPVLAEACYECHSATAATKKNLKGGLLLDTREATRNGGESGPAVVPGKPGESLLIAALKHESFKMPPKGKLPDAVIADFVKWVESGAADPRDGSAPSVPAEIDIEAGRKHWAFQPLAAVTAPNVQDANWGRTPIDAFVRSKLEAAGVTPNGVANPRVLIRRAYFDLTGLPPQPEDVNRFVTEAGQNLDAAWSNLIDGLLDSERYGERWARHWLDLSRFAESNGYAFDLDRPNAWHYRDFVIRALNSDMPYDEFIRLQLAGDLLTDVNVKTSGAADAAIFNLAATGYLVAGPFTSQQTQKERERSRYEQLDDIVSTMGTSLLGLTLGCSRCHSHKYDPLPISDYYRLTACLAEVGSSNTGVNTKPESYYSAKAAYDAAHQPLTGARTKYEQEQLAAKFDEWYAKRATVAPAPAEVALKLEQWQFAGPFPAGNYDAAFAMAFDPEKSVDLAASYLDGTVKWMPQPDWQDGTVHNTLTGENSANYLFRVIESATDQKVRLLFGSDDGLKVWVNGAEVLSNATAGAAAADEESVEVSLKAGRNELLLKIVNGAGPSGFYFKAAPQRPYELAGVGHWSHIGPFASASFDAAFDEVSPPEREIDLAKAYGDDGKLKWVAQPEWKDGVAHNDELSGTNCSNYLYRIIESDTPQVVALSLGSDDGIKLWVNGREVLSKKVGRNTAAAGQESVTVQLAPGRNEILMKIVNSGGKSGYYFGASAGDVPKAVADLLNLERDKWNDNQKLQARDWFNGFDLDWLALNQAVARHEVANPKPELTEVFAAQTRGMTYQFGADTYKVYQLRRGNSDNKEDEAQPGFLRVLMTSEQGESRWLASLENGADKAAPPRLALANWLSDTQTGAGHLLARVMVNRLWHYHFGRGIVSTPSDFGTRGERPTHPDLLDWLATELIRNEWRLKPIHRLIMSSSAYMQDDAVTESGRQRDPENRLIWRRESRRLEAESIRDSLLSVSGKLDLTMYGKGTLDTSSSRRSVYFTMKRGQLIPILQLFDAPDAMQSVGAREESTVAPQALALINSPIVREVATQLAQRVRPAPDVSVEKAIQSAYEITLSRPPLEDEAVVMKSFIDSQTAARAGNGAAEQLAVRDFCHLLLCTNEFVYVD